MHYRRDYSAGSTYFFTVVTFRRKPLLKNNEAVSVLREAIRAEMVRRPFQIDAMIILPDHIHALWTLPLDDADYSIRWRNIKRSFTQHLTPAKGSVLPGSRQHKGEQAIWQRRFWEHRIRDEDDLNHHINYIHYNPVKHGLVAHPVDWQFSSIHRYIQQGVFKADWGISCDLNIPKTTGHE